MYVTEPVDRAPEVGDFKIETADIDLAKVGNEKGALVLENLCESWERLEDESEC